MIIKRHLLSLNYNCNSNFPDDGIIVKSRSFLRKYDNSFSAKVLGYGHEIWITGRLKGKGMYSVHPNLKDNFNFITTRSICIWNFPGAHFLTFGLNTEIYNVCNRKTPNMGTFQAVQNQLLFRKFYF